MTKTAQMNFKGLTAPLKKSAGKVKNVMGPQFQKLTRRIKRKGFTKNYSR